MDSRLAAVEVCTAYVQLPHRGLCVHPVCSNLASNCQFLLSRCGGKHAIIEAGSKSFVNSINPRCSRLGGWLAAHQGSSHKDSATSFGSMHGTFTA